MKIAFIIPRIDSLGPIFVTQTLINSLCNYEDLEMKLFYFDKQVDPEIKLNIPSERLDLFNFNFEDFDIVHTNGIRPDLFAFLNRKKIRYHISTIHNFVFDDLTFTYNMMVSWLFGHMWLRLWSRADKLVCVSKTMKEYYSKYFCSDKLDVIYNGIAESDNSLIPDIDIVTAINNFHLRGLKVIGTAGILTRRKGIDQILDLVAGCENLALVVIGKGKEFNNLQHIADILKISDRCLFCGFRRHPVNCFKYFDFFIISSRSEGFSLVLVEAVQQRAPVICSDIEVFRELFNSDEVTFFVLENTVSLSSSYNTALKDGRGKIDIAYSRYRNYYTDEIMAAQYYELFMSA
jgi:L-malate glycosyltransferase